ncbi:MAG TPA: glycosyltransferase family 4 protein [Ignavibacteriaceae bacterium]|nr:glycosyltransferase family 4 protein [Ignavibacteriaceae bacterium]
MTILYITSFYSPNEVGGIEVQTRAMAESMCEDHDVYLLCFDSSGKNSFDIINGVKVIRTYVPGLSDILLKRYLSRERQSKLKLFLTIFSWRINSHLKKAVKKVLRNTLEKNPEIIHFSSNFVQFNFANLLKTISKLYPYTPKIISIHDHFLLGRSTVPPNMRVLIWSLYKRKILAKYSLYYICPSTYFSNLIVEDLRKENQFVLTLNHFIPFKYEIYPRKDDYIKILFAGNFEYQKGPDIVSRAFVDLFVLFPMKLKLYLVGDGEYRNVCEEILKEIPDEFKFFSSKLEREKLFQLMKQMDFVVVPSRYNESFGLVAAEAILAGALPIVSNKGGLPEVVNFVDDLIFINEPELFNLLKNLIVDKTKFHQLKIDIKSQLIKFSPENYKLKLNNFYSSIKLQLQI